MATNNSRAVFDATAATYDRDRMKLIPGHEAFYAAALELIPTDATHIVELGAGSGLFSAMLRVAFPEAHLTLIDFSENMLALARGRLGSDPHITFSLADYTTEPLPQPTPAPSSPRSPSITSRTIASALCCSPSSTRSSPAGSSSTPTTSPAPHPSSKRSTSSAGSPTCAPTGQPSSRSPTRSSGNRRIAARPSRCSSPGCARLASPTSTAGTNTPASPS